MVTAAESSMAARARYEPVIGLEVRVQLLTVTKIFCSCSTRFGDPPNTNVCPVCLGLPGALPVLNRKAVEYAVLAAMALNCRINETSIFAPLRRGRHTPRPSGSGPATLRASPG